MTTAMTSALAMPVDLAARLDLSQIESQLRNCPRLPSLGSVDSALRALLSADNRYTSQIAEIIRRDPSLTERLLRLVNSVCCGFSTPVSSIDDAVFFLGVRQIRQLAMMTPIIEDLQHLAGNVPFAWRDFWRHCIATAILTREIGGALEVSGDEAEYVAGLVHDVGKIAMAATFPDHFAQIQRVHQETDRELVEVEQEILGIDHAELGALYLQSHRLPGLLVEATRFHHYPERATNHRRVVAAVQIADLLARYLRLGWSGNHDDAAAQSWSTAMGWSILCEGRPPSEQAIIQAGLLRSAERLPGILQALI